MKDRTIHLSSDVGAMCLREWQTTGSWWLFKAASRAAVGQPVDLETLRMCVRKSKNRDLKIRLKKAIAKTS